MKVLAPLPPGIFWAKYRKHWGVRSGPRASWVGRVLPGLLVGWGVFLGGGFCPSWAGWFQRGRWRGSFRLRPIWRPHKMKLGHRLR